ncbi:PRD domain-containing protein [Actinomyces lilanjuaniae]|uniref:PRD domain-containing protein n=1 Tax=Actinomyces lilanjuaniae TaxID=2321394 RepID=A0ABM6Z1F3_9ACTO|nr:PRD domain-containing protein [Actinomyces lilanjuaniae]AYD89042.1 PRD domain-containing protein [Actinomyces lilanjuaniae]
MARFNDIIPILEDSPGLRVPAARIARRLGVSTRTVRNYVSAANRRYGNVVTSTRAGYSLDTEAWERAGATGRRAPRPGDGPVERLAHLLRLLMTTSSGLSVFGLAEELCVSESTIESDLTRARVLLAHSGLRITRTGETVRMEGEEVAQRRLMRGLLTKAAASRRQVIDVEEVARQLDEPTLPGLRQRMISVLGDVDLVVNDRTADELVAHIAVMVERVRAGHTITWLSGASGQAVLRPMSQAVATLVEEQFGIHLPDQEITYLALLLLEKAAPAHPEGRPRPEVQAFLEPRYVRLVSDIVSRVNDNYLIDLSDERFISFLALHVRRLVDRACQHTAVPVPAGQSVKNTHPLVHELAVFIAQQVERSTGVEVAEDEIGFLAFHVGGRLLSMHEHDDQVDVTLVLPRYYDAGDVFRQAVEGVLAGRGRVGRVVADLDEVDGADEAGAGSTDAGNDGSGAGWPVGASRTVRGRGTDLVVVAGTARPFSRLSARPRRRQPRPAVVRTGVLPSHEDLERVRSAVADVAAGRRRLEVASWLAAVMDPSLFLRVEGGGQRDDVLPVMAQALVSRAAAGEGFLEQVMERERLSSTAFASGAALPHTIEMTAARSAVMVCLARQPVDWDGTPVRLVALLCLSEDSRTTFGDVFDNLVHALLDKEVVTRLAASTSYDELVQTVLEVV